MSKIKILLAFISIVAFFIAMFYYDSYIDKKTLHKASKLKSEGEVAIGEIIGKGYDNVQGVSRLRSVLYWFTSDKIEKVSASLMSQEIRSLSKKNEKTWKDNFYWTEKGDKYIVLYDKNNPENSILLLDMPVKDSLDFKKFVTTIEKFRKSK